MPRVLSAEELHNRRVILGALRSGLVAQRSLPKSKYSVDSPPGSIEKRVFVGGNYCLMPILREISRSVLYCGYQPIIAYDFDIPEEKTRDYTLRLVYQCRHAIFEETIPNGHVVETIRAAGLSEIRVLQVYMAMDQRKAPPKTMSIMVWQSVPPPQGYTTISELNLIVQSFLMIKPS